MISIGEKVKSLRKERHMTQGDLAGTEMTRSMLSQIENGVSMPSMKTLQYLADKLEKPVSYFLETEKEPVNIKLELTLFSDLDSHAAHMKALVDQGRLDQARNELDALLKAGKLKDHPKSYTDIVFKLGMALTQSKGLAESEKYLKLATHYYISHRFYTDAVNALLQLGQKYLESARYDDCVELINAAFEAYSKAIIDDSRFEIELYYFKSLLLCGLGDLKEVPALLEKALKLSNESVYFYKTDELNRLKAVVSYFKGDQAGFNESVAQALKFAEIQQNKTCLANIHCLIAMKASDDGDVEKCLEHNRLSQEFIGKSIYLHYMLDARAAYIHGDYQAALEHIKRVSDPGRIIHKLDAMIFWTHRTISGLILHKLGRSAEGIDDIRLCIEKLEQFMPSRLLADAWRALSEVYSELKDFEKAYTAIKKADEIRDKVDRALN